jgi:hypothetical protein
MESFNNKPRQIYMEEKVKGFGNRKGYSLCNVPSFACWFMWN